MGLSENEFSYLDEKIRSLATAYTASGQPYLLSRLGKDLGVDLRTIKAGYAGSLAAYIKERLSAEFSVVLMGQHGNIQALVPASAAPLGVHMAVDAEIESAVPELPKATRFNYRFWAAFAVPLSDGNRRWLNMDDFTFKDQVDKPSGGDVREIPAALVPDATIENRDGQIRSNIASWLAAEQLPEEMFIAALRQAATTGAGRSATKTGQSVLEAMIGALDKRQLASTSLTLDVVASLLRTRV